MKWITRERPKIDRIACPWLIQKFVDPAAELPGDINDFKIIRQPAGTGVPQVVQELLQNDW